MSRIIPSIVVDSKPQLIAQIAAIEAFSSGAQVDFMDGRLAPPKSVSPPDLFDIATNLELIAHLMVAQPEDYIDSLVRAGFSTVIFHYEGTADAAGCIKAIAATGMRAGVALVLDTPNEVLEPLVPIVDSVMFLAVAPLSYGSPFEPRVIDKITDFRRRHSDTRIAVDGGMDADNLVLVKNLVDDAYIGTAIFAAGDPAENFRRLADVAADDC